MAIQRTVDHIAGERGTLYLIPSDFHMPVVSNRVNVGGGRETRCHATSWRVIVNPNLVNNERVPHAIRAPLVEDNIPQILGPEFVDRARVECGERDAHLYPAPGGEIAGKLPHGQRFAEGSRDFCNL